MKFSLLYLDGGNCDIEQREIEAKDFAEALTKDTRKNGVHLDTFRVVVCKGDLKGRP